MALYLSSELPVLTLHYDNMATKINTARSELQILHQWPLTSLFFYSSNWAIFRYKWPLPPGHPRKHKGQVIRFRITLQKGVLKEMLSEEPGAALMTESQIIFSLSPKWLQSSLGFCLKLQFSFICASNPAECISMLRRVSPLSQHVLP